MPLASPCTARTIGVSSVSEYTYWGSREGTAQNASSQEIESRIAELIIPTML
jgi:hypothetical protein